MNEKLQYLDEKYFSDMLKELLTTVGSKAHNFKLEFARKFVEKIYDDNKKYALQNSTVIREYPLNILKSNKHPRTKYLDLLFLDLDETDDVVIGIENKFLTTDSEDQITEYDEALERQFTKKRVKIIYLTLDGRCPFYDNNKKVDGLVCLSWINDILPCLEALKPKKPSKEMNKFIKNLQLIRSIMNDKNTNDSADIDTIIEYIEELKGNYNSRIRSIKIADTVSYYKLEYGKNKVWIPKSINSNQAEHMIHQFCITAFNKKMDYDKLIKDSKLKNLFAKNNINIEHNIKSYFTTKPENDKC